MIRFFAKKAQNDGNYRVIPIEKYAFFNLILLLMVGWLTRHKLVHIF